MIDISTLTHLVRTILGISSYFLTIQSILNAVGYMLLYVSTFEFICVQSPQSIRGILVCSFFAIKGCFQLLGVLVIFAPFAAQWSSPYIFPSRGFVYYLISVVLLLTGIMIFILAAKRYQYQGKIDHKDHYRNVEGHSQSTDVLECDIPDNAN